MIRVDGVSASALVLCEVASMDLRDVALDFPFRRNVEMRFSPIQINERPEAVRVRGCIRITIGDLALPVPGTLAAETPTGDRTVRATNAQLTSPAEQQLLSLSSPGSHRFHERLDPLLPCIQPTHAQFSSCCPTSSPSVSGVARVPLRPLAE